jgi:hypothetical protein
LASAGTLLFWAACGKSGKPPADAATGSDVAGDTAPRDAPIELAIADVQLPEVPADEPAGTFVAVGYQGRRIRSIDDGRSWTDDTSLEVDASSDLQLLRTVIWANGQFMAYGWRVMSSPDGKTWQDFGANAIDQWVGSVVYAQGLFVGVGGYGLRVSSPDGLTWQGHDLDTVPSATADALVYDPDGNGSFVSANSNGQRSISTDGQTWTYSTGAAATPTTDLAVGNGVVVGTNATGVVVSDDGGVTWNDAAQLGVPAQLLIFAQGHFTVIGAAHVFTSTDGRSWSDHSVAGLHGAAIAFGHGTYVLLTDDGFRHSTDGIGWGAPLASPSTATLVGLTFGSI